MKVNSDDEAVYVGLLNDHQSMIRAFIISLMPGAPGVEDVIQETNRILWLKRSDFTIGSNFRAWAMTICRYQSMTHLRRLRQQNWVTLSEDLAENLADEMEDDLEPQTEEHRRRALQSCMAKLRPADRELLIERYWKKTRLQDFSVVTGRSVSALRVTLFRLRATLKRCIQNQLENPSSPAS